MAVSMARPEGFRTRPNDLAGANSARAGLAHTSNVIIRSSS